MLNFILLVAGVVVLAIGVIFGIGLPVVSHAAATARSRQDYGHAPVPAPKRHLFLGVVVSLAGFVLMMIGFAQPFVEVPAGNVGVVTNFGQVQPGTLEPGLHVIIPIVQHVETVDTRVQPHNFNEIDAASREMQTVRLTGTMNYHVDGQYASDLYQRVGTDFASKVIDPAFNDFIKTVVPTYSVDTILGNRDQIRSKAKEALSENLAQYHIIVDDIYIANIAFSDEYQKAIEAKQVAQQQVQTEQQILQQKQIQAQQQVAQAQGQADSAVVSAKGQAEANSTLAKSLTPEILQNLMIQKLGDKIQVILMPGNGTPYILDPKTLLTPTASAKP